MILTDIPRRASYLRLVRMHFEANVGHLGGNLSCLDALLVLFHCFLRKNDKFVLSKGHSAGALYVALWSAGMLPEADLCTFHSDGTLLAGHPPAHGISAVPFATGSLGHGLSLAAGVAVGMRMKECGDHVYCLTSDGEWQEGSTWEALIFGIHHSLNNLTIMVDHNGLQGFGTTSEVASMAPLWSRLSGFDIELVVIDGHNIEQIYKALSSPHDRLRIIFLDSIKGKGISFLEGRMESHYLPLTPLEYENAIKELELN